MCDVRGFFFWFCPGLHSIVALIGVAFTVRTDADTHTRFGAILLLFTFGACFSGAGRKNHGATQNTTWSGFSCTYKTTR